MSRRARRRRASLLVVPGIAAILAGAAACGGPPAVYDLPPGTRIDLTVVLTEELEFEGQTSRMQLDLLVRGTARAGDGVDATIERVELTRQDAGGARVELSSDTVAARRETLSPVDLVRLGLLDALRGTELTLALDPADGLIAVDGLAAALGVAREGAAAANGGASVEGAWKPVTDLLDRGQFLNGLRAAGLGPVPARVDDALPDRRRVVPVRVSGKGTARVELRGFAGAESDGSPVVKVEGGLRPDQPYEGPVDAPPPVEVFGPIRLAAVRASASTLYDRDTHRPLRGTFESRVPYERGFMERRRTSFTLIVNE